VLAPVLVLPLLALGMLAVFEPGATTAGGLLLVASCPIGGISNAYSYLARASPALSVTLTTLSSALAFGTIPAVSWGFEQVLGRPLQFSAPAILPLQLVLLVLLPVVLGMWIRMRWPDVAMRRRDSVRQAAFGALAALLVIVIARDVDAFLDGLTETVPLALVFVVASFATGLGVGAVIGAPPADRFTLAAEFATRNVAVATAIAVTLLNQSAFALFGAAYFLTELPLLLLAVAVYRARWSSLVSA
jgi:bile acid:Na+ symporter, BASS family